jgi:cyanate permease
MDDFTTGVVQVLTVVNIATALIGGSLAGWFLIGQVAADPTWISPTATPRGVGILTGAYSIAVGAMFYLGQTVAGIVDGDGGWPRLATRFVLWALFCVALGVATWLRLVLHTHGRRRQAHDRAQAELDEARR